MCLIFFSVNNHPFYKLIIAANRDEFYKRKTEPASFWSDHPNVLAGRDLEAGGTWMGVSKEGGIAMVTNYRDLKNINPAAPSRGHLVSDYLIEDRNPEEYLKEISLSASDYNGFNLVVGDKNQLFYFSNYQNKIVPMKSGIFGLSNHLLDTPWPKVTRGKEKISAILDNKSFSKNDLFEFMQDSRIASDDQLPNTGLPIARERALSAMFIKTPDYGSRCSTVITVDREDNLEFTERVFDLTTFEYTEKSFRL